VYDREAGGSAADMVSRTEERLRDFTMIKLEKGQDSSEFLDLPGAAAKQAPEKHPLGPNA